VAGDQLKTASDLGVPIVGGPVSSGLFRQVIDRDGSRRCSRTTIPAFITPCGRRTAMVALAVNLPTPPAACLAGQGQRLHLYLLDSNDANIRPTAASPASFTAAIRAAAAAGAGTGIGGWRLLKTLNGPQSDI
jgi:starch phosphorylase